MRLPVVITLLFAISFSSECNPFRWNWSKSHLRARAVDTNASHQSSSDQLLCKGDGCKRSKKKSVELALEDHVVMKHHKGKISRRSSINKRCESKSQPSGEQIQHMSYLRDLFCYIHSDWRKYLFASESTRNNLPAPGNLSQEKPKDQKPEKVTPPKQTKKTPKSSSSSSGSASGINSNSNSNPSSINSIGGGGVNKGIPKPSGKSSAPTRTSNQKPKDQGGLVQKWLDVHNRVRKLYKAGNLEWSETLAASAQSWSNKCIFEHSQTPYGQNLAAGQPTLEQVLKDWTYGINECSVYNPARPIYSHFTQVVWVNTKKVGCGIARCANLPGTNLQDVLMFTCEYDPAGNVEGQYALNVLAGRGDCRR